MAIRSDSDAAAIWARNSGADASSMVRPSAVQLEPVASGFVPRHNHSVDSDEPGTNWPSRIELRTGHGPYTTVAVTSRASVDAEINAMSLTRFAHSSSTGMKLRTVVRVNAASPSKAPRTPRRCQPGRIGNATHAHRTARNASASSVSGCNLIAYTARPGSTATSAPAVHAASG